MARNVEITAKHFEARVGRPPQNDDLERCNCLRAGYFGHWLCGWDTEVDLPRSVSGRPRLVECPID